MAKRSMTSTLDKLRDQGKLQKLTAKPKPGNAGSGVLALSKVTPDPDQPRRQFDEEKLAALSESIKVHGVLQAITVQPENAEGQHLIIMGERRYRAAKLAGLKEIPAVIREATSELRSIQITENIHRDDLTTMEIAQAVEQLKSSGMKREDIAVSLGWGKVQVSQFAGVMSMPGELQELAEANVPVRALSDLNAVWKKDTDAAREFLRSTPVEDVTRVSVAALREAIEASPGGGEPDPEPKVGPVVSSSPEKDVASGAEKTVSRGVAILCRVGDDIGRILTDRKAGTKKAIMVSFDNGDRIEEVALTDLELFEVIELS